MFFYLSVNRKPIFAGVVVFYFCHIYIYLAGYLARTHKRVLKRADLKAVRSPAKGPSSHQREGHFLLTSLLKSVQSHT